MNGCLSVVKGGERSLELTRMQRKKISWPSLPAEQTMYWHLATSAIFVG